MASAITQTLFEWRPQSQTMRAMLNDLENDQEKRTKKNDFKVIKIKKKEKRRNQMMFTLRAVQE